MQSKVASHLALLETLFFIGHIGRAPCLSKPSPYVKIALIRGMQGMKRALQNERNRSNPPLLGALSALLCLLLSVGFIFAQSVDPLTQPSPPNSAPNSENDSQKDPELAAYKAKLYRMIGARWYLNVQKNMPKLALGKVEVKFFIAANGVIDPKSISIAGDNSSGALAPISLDAVSQSYGEPFSDTLKKQLGNGYWDQITFTMTPPGTAPSTTYSDPDGTPQPPPSNPAP